MKAKTVQSEFEKKLSEIKENQTIISDLRIVVGISDEDTKGEQTILTDGSTTELGLLTTSQILITMISDLKGIEFMDVIQEIVLNIEEEKEGKK